MFTQLLLWVQGGSGLHYFPKDKPQFLHFYKSYCTRMNSDEWCWIDAELLAKPVRRLTDSVSMLSSILEVDVVVICDCIAHHGIDGWQWTFHWRYISEVDVVYVASTQSVKVSELLSIEESPSIELDDSIIVVSIISLSIRLPLNMS